MSIFNPVPCWRVKFRSNRSKAWYFTGPYFATKLEARIYERYWHHARTDKDTGSEDTCIVQVNYPGATHHYPPMEPTKLNHRGRKQLSKEPAAQLAPLINLLHRSRG